MKYGKYPALFCAGGTAYMGLELLWRGRTHGSMFVAGGTCFLLIGQLNHVRPRLPLPFRAVAGAGIVTMVELGIGLLCNRNYEVWDYRERAGNFLGQICPMFTALWVPVSLLALFLHEWLSSRMDRLSGRVCP